MQGISLRAFAPARIPRLIAFAVMFFAAQPALGETIVISQRDKMFSEEEITVDVGESVQFRNDDDTAHSVLSYTPGFEFTLELQRPCQIGSISFDKPAR
ncbi:MAG: hypothetical protein RLN70_00830, partial [Rhodospirillaceae bacterium]